MPYLLLIQPDQDQTLTLRVEPTGRCELTCQSSHQGSQQGSEPWVVWRGLVPPRRLEPVFAAAAAYPFVQGGHGEVALGVGFERGEPIIERHARSALPLALREVYETLDALMRQGLSEREARPAASMPASMHGQAPALAESDAQEPTDELTLRAWAFMRTMMVSGSVHGLCGALLKLLKIPIEGAASPGGIVLLVAWMAVGLIMSHKADHTRLVRVEVVFGLCAGVLWGALFATRALGSIFWGLPAPLLLAAGLIGAVCGRRTLQEAQEQAARQG